GFDFSVSLLLLTVLFVAGRQPIFSAVLGSVLLVIIPSYATGATAVKWNPIIFGSLAIVAALFGGRSLVEWLGSSRRLRERSAAWRARLGLGRTFQRMELFDTMTVRENVEIGREALLAGKRRWMGRLFSTPTEAAVCSTEAEEAMEHCGISGLANRTVGDLSTGQRRLVELARAMAGDYRFLLLDEPSSGLDVG